MKVFVYEEPAEWARDGQARYVIVVVSQLTWWWHRRRFRRFNEAYAHVDRWPEVMILPPSALRTFFPDLVVRRQATASRTVNTNRR